MTQVAAAHHLQEVTRKEVEGRAKLGISAFAEALLGIPKILAENSGYDAQVWRPSLELLPLMCHNAQAGCMPLLSHTGNAELQIKIDGNLVQDTIIALDEEVAKGNKVGLDVATGKPMDPTLAGIYDNLSVKRQMLQSAPVVASQLLLVDEVIRAHIRMKQ